MCISTAETRISIAETRISIAETRIRAARRPGNYRGPRGSRSVNRNNRGGLFRKPRRKVYHV
jgi:hypothetical protein